jgi:hypothetical protein
MDPAKLKAIADWPVPRTKTKLKWFSVFSNFYRRFIGSPRSLNRFMI